MIGPGASVLDVGCGEGYFLRLQNSFDTMEAKRKIAAQVAKIKPYRQERCLGN